MTGSQSKILMFAAVLLLAFGARAQGAKPNAEPEPKEQPGTPEAGAKPVEADADDPQPEVQPDAAEAGDDLGERPPPAKRSDDGKRLSPLTPRPDEFPKGEVKPPPPDYDRLLSDIAALRGRVAALTTTLFKSKLRIIVEIEGDYARVSSFAVTLDDGVVFNAPERFVADDEKTVYEHAVAPGHHVIGVEIEREDARGKQYKTWQTSKFSVVVPDSQLLEAHVVVEDDSDMAEDFPDDADGEYDMRVRLRARVTEP